VDGAIHELVSVPLRIGDGMKFDFGTRAMDIGTGSFNLVRTLSVAATGGAEAGKYLPHRRNRDVDRL
jgi:hypothetical protein